jgi:hypothetical protein
MKQLIALGCVLSAALAPPPAAADDVHLDNGEVIEGRATRAGDKIVIELESGQISVSADSVKHIEKRESNVDRFEKQYNALKPEDVVKRLQLADYCRDHGMRDRERQLLQQIIERDPSHEQARTRLGYVKGPGGWVSYAEHMRAQGHVQRDGQWMSRAQASELDQVQAQQRAAARANAAAESSLEAKKVALERQKLELERQRLELEKSRTRRDEMPPVVGYYGYGYVPRGHYRSSGFSRDSHSHPQRGFTGPTYPINGVRDPRDNTWSLPGVRDPRDFSP